jgi:hypothetical protein
MNHRFPDTFDRYMLFAEKRNHEFSANSTAALIFNSDFGAKIFVFSSLPQRRSYFL